jgi:Rrf2 family protein
MRVTQQLRYSVYGIMDLAYHGGGRPVRIQQIGRRQRIPVRYLEQIFQKLRRAGLVESRRGPGGGYLLARPVSEISLADVVRAVEGDILPAAAGEAEEEGSHPFAFTWKALGTCVADALAERSIGDLCGEAARRGVERTPIEPAMYEI